MGRLPFDPSKMAAARAAASEPESSPDAPLSVSQLATRLDAALRAGLAGPIRVVGELSGFRDRTHWYFDLKDADAVINCAMWQSHSRRQGFTPTNGQQVVVRGRVEFYPPQGKVTLVCDRIEPVGAGALEIAYRALLEEIRALGWTSPERKRALPRFPRKVAIVTSRSAAALQDVIVTMRARCPAVAILLADVRVQGDKAAAEVAAAIRTINAHRERLGVDAILVTRGGGSMEDLWAFNDRGLAHAIVESDLPVVAAIGHETDTTIAELVADERCATPTQAAMRLSPDAAALGRQLDSLQRRATGAVQSLMELAGARLATCAASPTLADPRGILARLDARLAHAADRMAHAADAAVNASRARADTLALALAAAHPRAALAAATMRLASAEVRVKAAWHARPDDQRLDRARDGLTSAFDLAARRAADRLDAHARHLQALSPLAVLARGFTLTRAADGTLVRDPAHVRPGDTLITTTAGGDIPSTVGAASPAPAQPASVRPACVQPAPSAASEPRVASELTPRVPARRTRPRTPPAPGLFDTPS